MEDIQTVATLYRIHLQQVRQITDNLFYISDGDNAFAVKKSNVSNERMQLWLQTYTIISNLQLDFMMPILLTNDGQLFVYVNDKIYYIMPWINDHKTYRVKKIFRLLGQLHVKTKHPYEYKQSFEIPLNSFKDECNDAFKFIYQTIEQFERKYYMSPFELQVCTHFHNIEKVFKHILYYIDDFNDECQKQIEWHYSLCHGYLQLDHIISAEQMYFINWERAHFTHPIKDLIHFLKQANQMNNLRDALMNDFSSYLEENRLFRHEYILLFIYLLNPSTYVNTIKQHIQQRERIDHHVINDVISLERAYRQLHFGLKWIDHFEKAFVTTLDEIDD